MGKNLFHGEWAEFTELKQDVSGQLSGIGARISLSKITRALTIIETFANSPAAKSGLKPGDRILAVDGKPVQELYTFKTISLVLGKPGTRVKLKIVRESKKIINITLTRQMVQVLIDWQNSWKSLYVRLSDLRLDCMIPG
jgi:carboxyl-terminal processing protease